MPSPVQTRNMRFKMKRLVVLLAATPLLVHATRPGVKVTVSTYALNYAKDSLMPLL